jgi:hypothetical protein
VQNQLNEETPVIYHQCETEAEQRGNHSTARKFDVTESCIKDGENVKFTSYKKIFFISE